MKINVFTRGNYKLSSETFVDSFCECVKEKTRDNGLLFYQRCSRSFLLNSNEITDLKSVIVQNNES